jgi:hypothetical protein
MRSTYLYWEKYQMSQRNPQLEARMPRLVGTGWDLMDCDRIPAAFKNPFSSRGVATVQSENVFAPDWAKGVPELIEKLVSEVVEKKKMELRFSLMECAVSELKYQLNAITAAKARIVPIANFAPEPYKVLMPILVSVKAVEDEFEAGWFDANIHTTGENEEESVSNLKNLILDYFDSFSKEPIENLGVEPKRQFAVLKTFISKRD